MPLGALTSQDIVDDYESFINSIKGLGLDLIITDPLNDDVSVLGKAREIRKLDVDALLIFALHGFTGHLQALAAEEVGVPTLIWSLPTRYSFPTSASAVGCLRDRGFRVKLIHAVPNDVEALKEVESFTKVAAVVNKLRRIRLGVIGGIIPPMVASYYDKNILRDRLGVDAVHIPIHELMSRYEGVSDDEVSRKLGEIKAKYLVKADEGDVRKPLKLYLAIKRLQDELRLDGVVLECYTELFDMFKVNPCLGYIDNQVIGCEGDVVNAVGLLIAQYLTGKPAIISDPYAVSRDGIITFMHCAAPASVADDPRKVSIVRAEPPSIIRARIPVIHCRPQVPPGTVTMFRIYGRYLDKMHVTSGELISSDISRALELKIKVDSPAGFINEVAGNHYVIALSDIRKELKLMCSWLGIKYIET